MDFYFGEPNDEGVEHKRAIVHVSIDPEFDVLKVDVDLFSLPERPYDSSEVVVDFHVDGLWNKRTFYTDSNGLEMQKRILDHRDTWDIVKVNYARSYDNVSANYYPINSAISIIDDTRPAQEGNLKLTVMNDRAQGGSALEPGSIQLMQNRRVFGDDGKGMDEYLNERDASGRGIRVPATYYVEVIDTNTTTSKQHQIHHKTDDPVQMFFTFDLVHSKSKAIKSGFSEAISAAGIDGKMTYVVFPEARNLVHIRIENLDDSLDRDSGTKWVDVKAVAEALWTQANIQNPMEHTVAITELSLTGNMKLAELQKRRIHWKTEDDKKLRPLHNQDKGNKKSFVPQQIRVFELAYKPVMKEQFLQ